jgi:predicted nucleic acid-binding protein
MIVLDTNVVSEIMRPQPDPVVKAWIDTVPSRETAIAATSVAELLYGVRIMPQGRRRAERSVLLARLLEELRILPFDDHAAELYAAIASHRRAAGNPIGPFDCQIAATARAAGASIATRDAGGFAGCGLEIIDLWSTE